MATLKVARIFTNQSIVLEIFGCARHSPNKFGSTLACAKICFEIFGCTRQYEQALLLSLARKFVRLVRPIRSPFYSLKGISVNSWNSWAKKTGKFVRFIWTIICPRMFYSPQLSRIFEQFVGKWNQPEHSFPNCKQTLSTFHSLRRAWFSRLQFLRFCFLGNFESLGKYNIDGLAKNFEAENFCAFVSSFQLSYMSAKTIL